MASELPTRLTERTPRSARVPVAGDVVARVTGLYEAGLYVDAYEASKVAGPLGAWSGAEALVIASRLAGNLGSVRLGSLLITRAHREHPRSGTVRSFWCHHLLGRHGPIVAEREARAAEAQVDDTWSSESRSDLLALRARVAATYRDGDASAALIARARAMSPNDPWPVTTASIAADLEDRPEQALALAREALAMRPGYRPALLHLAQLLHAAGRRDAAVELLEEAMRSAQCPAIPEVCYALLRESADPARLLGLLDRVEALSPLREPAIDAWLAHARCHVHGRRGDHAAAAREAARIGTEYHRALAERLSHPEPGWRRVRLPVPFVVQAHRTCGPATLAALSAFAGLPVPQDGIVEAICYGGTAATAERDWCGQHGFAAREFRVTWEAAVRLIDASLPFAIETRYVDSGHLQPVVGYDSARRTLLLQEPGGIETLEADAEELLGAQRLTGPRGLVFAPEGDRERLFAVDLPDAALYDLRHEAEAAFRRFDRAAGEAALGALDAAAPDHTLGWLTRLTLAHFDDDAVEIRRVLEALLARFPDDPRLVSQKLRSLRETGTRAERIALLERAVEGSAEEVAFRRELAGDRLSDARTWPQARRLLASVHRSWPQDARTLVLLAELEERRGASDRGLELRRFATSLEDTDEAFASEYARAAVASGRTEEALAWLRRRFATHGSKSSLPAMTLADALARLSLPQEGLEVLREAVRLRPADGALLVELADAEAKTGDFEPARQHLDAARPLTRPGAWWRAEAALRRRAGDLAGALAAWREVLAREPLALDAHRGVAWLLAALERPAAAVAHLEEAVKRFPHHVGLAATLLPWVEEGDPARAEALIRRVVELEPSDAWWRRELAVLLHRTGRTEEAIAAAVAAREIAPQSPASHGILANLQAAGGRLELAREGLREALRLDVDYAWAIDRLVDLAPGDARKREELGFVHAELLRQTTDGRGLSRYASAARIVLPAPELRRQLVAFLDARPDLFEAWSALVRLSSDEGELDDARRRAEQALERFPMHAEAWQVLSHVRRRQGDVAGAAEAARRAVRLSPSLTSAWLDLARHVHDGGDLPEATAVLREALRHDPLESRFATELAHRLELAGDAEGAWALCAQAVLYEPGCSDAWGRLEGLAVRHGRRDDLVALGRRVTQERPGDPDAWMALAGVLPSSATEEALASYARASSLAPRRTDAYDQRAVLLAGQGRFDEARAVLSSGPWPEGARPEYIQGRDAWLLAEEGQVREAIARMLPVVERAGDYDWGWARLADWAERVDDTAVWEKAAAALVRLSPTDPPALSTAAEVEIRLGRRARGEALFREALAHDPGYRYAAYQLLSLGWTARDQAALSALPTLVRRDGPTEAIARAALALSAAIAGDAEKALAEARTVMRALDAGDALAELLDTAFSKDLATAWGVRYERLLDELVADDTVGPAFARRFVAREARRKRWAVVRRFDAWLPRFGERAHPALRDLLDAVGEHQAAKGVVKGLIRRHGDRLREDVQLWGKVGYALTAADLDADCVRWLEGGERRPDAEAWMLLNLAGSLRALKRDRQAEAVSLAVVRRGLRDMTWPRHVARAAYGEALAGRPAEARQLLASAPTKDGEESSPSLELLRALVLALCDVLESPDRATARQRFRMARGRLRAKAEQRSDAALDERRDYAGAITAMARRAGVPWPLYRRGWPGELRFGPWLWYVIWGGFVLLQILRMFAKTEQHLR